MAVAVYSGHVHGYITELCLKLEAPGLLLPQPTISNKCLFEGPCNLQRVPAELCKDMQGAGVVLDSKQDFQETNLHPLQICNC